MAVPPLSPRQLEVLRLLADGLTAKEIAAALGIAVQTAKLHRAALCERLGARNAAHAVRLGWRWLELPNGGE